MAEIFVSYARKDEAQAKKIVEALCARGHRAWRDDELPPNRAYAEVIEERLNSADAVIVLWSETQKKSQWVSAEADDARNRGTLIHGLTEPFPRSPSTRSSARTSANPITRKNRPAGPSLSDPDFESFALRSAIPADP